MSLLIPTTQDYNDAREGLERAPFYHEYIAKADLDRDPETNQYKYPWNFEVVHDFFVQSNPDTDDAKFNYALSDFGLTKPWSEVLDSLNELNKNAKSNESYKLLFLARHGQGNHNVVVLKYGAEEWRRKWHALGKDGDMEYAPDPVLTEIGINQAKENHDAWKQQLTKGAPIPSKFYVSPLQRSCNTLYHTWHDLVPGGLKPLIVEDVREVIGFHLCNKRSNKTTIMERFAPKGFEIEPGFVEEDIYHSAVAEEADEHCLRTNRFMQRLFDENWDKQQKKADSASDQVVSVTSHGGTIKTFLVVIGHRTYTIPTGGMIPVVVKATRKVEE